MSGEVIGTIVMIVVGALVFGTLAVGMVLVVRDTIRRRGNWGINLKPATCTECGTPIPVVRAPTSFNQALWGGWTCKECGFKLDKWGRRVEGQSKNAKWAVLRAVEEAREPRRKPRSREERIQEANDEFQSGGGR